MIRGFKIDWDIQGAGTRINTGRGRAHSLLGTHSFSLQHPSVFLILHQEQIIQSFTRLLVRHLFFNAASLAVNITLWCTSFFGGETGSRSTPHCNLCDHITSACCCFAHGHFRGKIYSSPNCLIPFLCLGQKTLYVSIFLCPLLKETIVLFGWNRVFVTEKCVGGLSYSFSVEEMLLFIKSQDNYSM